MPLFILAASVAALALIIWICIRVNNKDRKTPVIGNLSIGQKLFVHGFAIEHENSSGVFPVVITGLTLNEVRVDHKGRTFSVPIDCVFFSLEQAQKVRIMRAPTHEEKLADEIDAKPVKKTKKKVTKKAKKS